jgi:hypothetical protein
MITESTSTSTNPVGARAAVIANLKTQAAPEEGGTKEEHDDFLEKIRNHVTIGWDFGKDVGHLLKHMAEPFIPGPKDMTEEEEKVKWKKATLGPGSRQVRHKVYCTAREQRSVMRRCHGRSVENHQVEA